MSHFVYDNTSLLYPKAELRPVPEGADVTKYIRPLDWNTVNQAVVDLRNSFVAGKFHGFTAQASDPAPTNSSTYIWLKTDDAVFLETSVTNQFAVGPVTTKGDLLVFNGTKFVSVAIGTNGQALKANSATASGVDWGTFVTAAYSTMKNNGSILTQRSVLNVDGTLLQMADNGGATRTDLTAPGLVPKTTILTAGTGLSGGGNLSTDRTFSVDQSFSPTWSGTHTFNNPISGSISGNAAGVTIQQAYTNGTSPEAITLTAGKGFIQIKDAASTITTLFKITDNGESTTFLSIGSDVSILRNFKTDKPIGTTIGGDLSSGAAIAPTFLVHHVTGTSTISTITVPANLSTWGGYLILIPDGTWATDTAGNIALVTTAIVGKVLILVYDPGTVKWYPSY